MYDMILYILFYDLMLCYIILHGIILTQFVSHIIYIVYCSIIYLILNITYNLQCMIFDT